MLEGGADTVHAHVEGANEILISHKRLRQGVHAQHAFVKRPKTTIIGRTTNKPPRVVVFRNRAELSGNGFDYVLRRLARFID